MKKSLLVLQTAMRIMTLARPERPVRLELPESLELPGRPARLGKLVQSVLLAAPEKPGRLERPVHPEKPGRPERAVRPESPSMLVLPGPKVAQIAPVGPEALLVAWTSRASITFRMTWSRAVNTEQP